MAKLVREIVRAETQATEHAPREAKRIGEAPPIQALREVASHAAAMRARFGHLLDGHDVTISRTGLGATLASLRSLVVDRVIDPERAYRAALLDLRHGIDVVKLLRELARADELFGVIRWCDDWLGARRSLVARVEAQLPWFGEQVGIELGIPMPPSDELETGDTHPFEMPRAADATIPTSNQTSNETSNEPSDQASDEVITDGPIAHPSILELK